MKKNKASTIVMFIAVGFVLFLIILAGINHHTRFIVMDSVASESESIGNNKEGKKLQIDANAGEYVEPESEETPNEGIAIPGWGYISIPANETEIAVDFPNPEANDDKYYLSFELRLKDSGEVLYSSGLVPPGQTIQKITLSHALEEGTYAAIVHVQPYTMDESQTATNNADMETELVVFKR